MYNPFSLNSKKILVTGASSGIGKGIAIDISKMEANVYILARNEERLKETYSLMQGDENIICIADLCNTENLNNLIDTLPVLV